MYYTINTLHYHNIIYVPVDHLSKYLAMRLTLDLDAELPEAYRLLNFCIYVAPSPGQFVPLAGSQTLRQINDRFWKVSTSTAINSFSFIFQINFCHYASSLQCTETFVLNYVTTE